jgi:hypothetical protein
MKTLTVFLLACPLAAQAVSVSVSAATALTTRASAAGTNDVQTLPIGPLPPAGGLNAQVTSFATSQHAQMLLSWQITPPSQFERVLVGCSFLGVVNGNTNPASAGVDPGELLFQLTAPAPRWVFVAGFVDSFTPPGLPAPQIELDLFDDGVVEWSTSASFAPIHVLVGPTPVPVRFRCTATLPANGWAQGAGRLDITPDNRVDVYTLMQGCLPNDFLRVEAAFAHNGVRLRVPPGELCVGVLGLAAQPLLLATYGGFPCMLLPSPDVLLLIPQAGYDLPIPAAARPIDVYAQAVRVGFQSLQTTTGYRASAY